MLFKYNACDFRMSSEKTLGRMRQMCFLLLIFEMGIITGSAMEAQRLVRTLISGDRGRAPLTGMRALDLAEAAYDDGRTADALRLAELGHAIFARNVRRCENEAVRLMELVETSLTRNVRRADIAGSGFD